MLSAEQVCAVTAAGQSTWTLPVGEPRNSLPGQAPRAKDADGALLKVGCARRPKEFSGFCPCVIVVATSF